MFLLRNLLFATANVLDTVLGLYTLLIIGRVLVSWVGADPYNPLVRLLVQATEPALRPIRRRLPFMGGIDFSPLILILAVAFVRQFLVASLRDVALLL